ncbi:hypothetical protein TSOC_013893, partial [Tetrabaena socialis]
MPRSKGARATARNVAGSPSSLPVTLRHRTADGSKGDDLGLLVHVGTTAQSASASSLPEGNEAPAFVEHGVLEHLPNPISLLTADGEILVQNSASIAVWGQLPLGQPHSADAILGRLFEADPNLLQDVLQGLSEGRPWRGLLRVWLPSPSVATSDLPDDGSAAGEAPARAITADLPSTGVAPRSTLAASTAGPPSHTSERASPATAVKDLDARGDAAPSPCKSALADSVANDNQHRQQVEAAGGPAAGLGLGLLGPGGHIREARLRAATDVGYSSTATATTTTTAPASASAERCASSGQAPVLLKRALTSARRQAQQQEQRQQPAALVIGSPSCQGSAGEGPFSPCGSAAHCGVEVWQLGAEAVASPAGDRPGTAPSPLSRQPQQQALLEALTTSAWSTMLKGPHARRPPRSHQSAYSIAPSAESAHALGRVDSDFAASSAAQLPPTPCDGGPLHLHLLGPASARDAPPLLLASASARDAPRRNSLAIAATDGAARANALRRHSALSILPYYRPPPHLLPPSPTAQQLLSGPHPCASAAGLFSAIPPAHTTHCSSPCATFSGAPLSGTGGASREPSVNSSHAGVCSLASPRGGSVGTAGSCAMDRILNIALMTAGGKVGRALTRNASAAHLTGAASSSCVLSAALLEPTSEAPGRAWGPHRPSLDASVSSPLASCGPSWFIVGRSSAALGGATAAAPNGQRSTGSGALSGVIRQAPPRGQGPLESAAAAAAVAMEAGSAACGHAISSCQDGNEGGGPTPMPSRISSGSLATPRGGASSASFQDTTAASFGPRLCASAERVHVGTPADRHQRHLLSTIMSSCEGGQQPHANAMRELRLGRGRGAGPHGACLYGQAFNSIGAGTADEDEEEEAGEAEAGAGEQAPPLFAAGLTDPRSPRGWGRGGGGAAISQPPHQLLPMMGATMPPEDGARTLRVKPKRASPVLRRGLFVGSATGGAASLQPAAAPPVLEVGLSRLDAAQPGALQEQWHEVALVSFLHPKLRRRVILVSQNDVSSRIWAERQLARVVEAEHTLLENIFPHHVIEHITATIATNLDESGTPFEEQQQQDGASDAGAAGDMAQVTRDQDVRGSSAMDTAWLPAIRGDTFRHLSTSHTAITILFCDIQGFTPMCSQMRAVVVMSFLNDLFTRLDGLLDEYGVYK